MDGFGLHGMSWFGIDSAPKDGSRLLMFAPEAGVYVGSWWSGGSSTPAFWGDDGEGFEMTPSHWMPLPLQPDGS